MTGFISTIAALSSPLVEPWGMALAAASTAGLVVLLLRALIQARTVEISSGIESVVGKQGEASSELAPAGTVRVNSEEWTARADREPIHRGEKIEGVAVDGVTLRVKRLAAVGEMSRAPQEKDHA
jgi:membrane-bound ClpP family serine protease